MQDAMPWTSENGSEITAEYAGSTYFIAFIVKASLYPGKTALLYSEN